MPSADRLTLALEAGALPVPPAPVLLLRPPGDAALDALPPERHAVQGFRPDHDALAARGEAVSPDWPDGAFASAVLWLPRARALAEALVAGAQRRLPPGAPLLVTGAKASGVDALRRRLGTWAEPSEPFAKAHGKAFAVALGALPDAWADPPPRVAGFRTAPGLFSADGPDPGSDALLAALPPLAGRACDLGAGWGHLAARLLAAHEGVTALDLVEAEHDALACARANVADARAAFHWADARRWEGGPYDVVVTNPPFHAAGRAPDPSLGQAFLAAAAHVLRPSGRLFAVANRHLPYESLLRDAFAEVVTLTDAAGYKVFEARRPRRAGKRGGRP